MDRLSKVFFAIITACSAGCGGGGSSKITLEQPPLSFIKSDFPDNPQYGTESDPAKYTSCLILPPTSWQLAQGICPDGPSNINFQSGNFFSTTTSNKHWTVIANNEPTFDLQCNTGMPGKSQQINVGNVFSLENPTRDSIKLRIQHTTTNNCQKIPYLAINNFRANALVVNHGKNATVDFDLTADYSGDVNHFNFYNFFVLFENDGNRYFGWLFLKRLENYPDPDAFNWNWPIEKSSYFPGAKIKMTINHPWPKVKKGKTHYSINLDKVIELTWPNLNHSKSKILGFEFSLEQEFNWPSGAVMPPIYTEALIENLKVTSDN